MCAAAQPQPVLTSPLTNCYNPSMLLSERETKSICDKLLSWTKAEDAEVSVSSDDFSHLRFAANGFTTSGRREDASASITAWIDKKRGSAAANDLEDASLKMAVE